MILALWNYLRGYVILEVRGASAVRFINLAVRNGIYVWDVQESDAAEAALRLKVSVRAFWELRPYARKAGCKLRIVGRTGFPFVMRRYRKRRFLAIGALGFLLGLYVLSLFVWQIHIVGASRLSPMDIAQVVSGLGLRPGVLRLRAPKDEIEAQLLSRFEDIAWVNIDIRGTRATINLIETLPRQVVVDRNSPSDIVASHDGLIVNMVTHSGTPNARIDDVVRQGDVLVSSEVVVRDDEQGRIVRHVHSQAQIIARRYHHIGLSVPYTYVLRNFTGNEHPSYDIIILGRSFRLPLPTHGFSLYEQNTSLRVLSLGPDHPLPITLASHSFREIIETTHQRTQEEAIHLAEMMIRHHIYTHIPTHADIMDTNINFLTDHSPTELWVQAVVTLLEDIAQPQLPAFINEIE